MIMHFAMLMLGALGGGFAVAFIVGARNTSTPFERARDDDAERSWIADYNAAARRKVH